MSYDLFAQAFSEGQSSSDPSRSTTIHGVLRPFVSGSPDEGGVLHTQTADGGEADFYVGPDGHFMVNQFSSGETIGLIVHAARAAGLVIIGPGLPPILTEAEQLGELPATLAIDEPLPVLVASGEELEGLIAHDGDTYQRCRERLTSGAPEPRRSEP